jgi:hypothetical protein
MALVLANRVQETTTTTGTGTITLAGAVAGFQSFAVIGDGNTTYYTITSGTAWEVGIGTYTASGTTLARTTILSSSAGGAAITLAGTSAVFVAYPADKSVNYDASGNVTLTSKIVPNVQSVASAATITPNANTDTQVSVTALAVPATLAAPSGTPSDGQSLVIRIEDNGTGRALTWTTGSSGAYRAVGVTLPTTTVATKALYVGCKYNSTDLRWDVVAVSQEA